MATYVIFSFAIVFAIAFTAAMIVKHGIWPMLKSRFKIFEKRLTSEHILKHSTHFQNKQQLLSYFIQNENTNKYKSLEIKGTFAYSLLKGMLQKSFKIDILSEVCEWDKSSCIHCVKLEGPTNQAIYISFCTSKEREWATEATTLYKMVQDNGLSPELLKGNLFESMYNVTVVMDARLDDASNDLAVLYECLTASEVEAIRFEKKTKYTNIYRFALNANGYYLQQTSQEIPLYSDEVLNNSYNNQSFVYKGETFELTPAQQMVIAKTSVLHKNNIFTFGKPGCGKTTFGRQILAHLQDEPGVRLISIDPSLIAHLRNPATQSEFIRLLSETYNEEVYDYQTDSWKYENKQIRNIIFIDEAEVLLRKSADGLHTEDQTFLLSLMDGELRDLVNCQVIFVFNKEKEFLNPAIFRSVRGGVEFHVEPIPMDRAKKLVEVLKMQNLHWRFDAEKFHKFITDISLDSSGVLYAAAGFTTLADVISCFSEPELDDIIITTLRGMTIPKIEKQVSKAPEKPKAKLVPLVNKTVSTPTPEPQTTNAPSPAGSATPMKKNNRNRFRNRRNK